ncbi:NAD(P)/FAD-dependent oxidoreductase [Actinomadura algeriensis]|uniref:Glycine/D-amino acid oxidase-like deaminating enzyme n=1 Tax=Actinomadura algeriensis TaxID=1679523 RepID=A0ABR9JRU4_9ACTN|nr:FAD-dependent oxidoreductase [Actinomadura algeriensis]MBE1533287.1 glycine/D-amino acid oxidase-like deaminating enzyme [Actinomadura algeriensis]
MRIVIVGGGVLGTMHAAEAVRRGHYVAHVERDAEPCGASVRDIGLVRVGGRADGAEELSTALRARELWERIARDVPDVGFRPNGSLTVARTAAELDALAGVAERPDAAERGCKLLGAEEARAFAPALRGAMLGALWCERDAAVEPRAVLPALRAHLAETGRYAWLPGRDVLGLGDMRDVGTASVRDDHGATHEGDAVVLCTGAHLSGMVRELAPDLPVHRARLQLMQTAPLDEPLAAAAHAGRLRMVQRPDGGLTIGGAHAPGEPSPSAAAEAVLGRTLPPVRRRWSSVHARCADPSRIVHRARVGEDAWLVTGSGEHGLTHAPALAEETANHLNL